MYLESEEIVKPGQKLRRYFEVITQVAVVDIQNVDYSRGCWLAKYGEEFVDRNNQVTENRTDKKELWFYEAH